MFSTKGPMLFLFYSMMTLSLGMSPPPRKFLMISSSMIVVSLYLVSLVFFYSSGSCFVLWIMMEINMLAFLWLSFYLEIWDRGKFFKLGLFYFLVQSLGSFTFLFFILMSDSDFIFLADILFLCSMAIKIGLFPTTFWVIQMAPHISSYTLYFLLVFQKIPYFYVFFTLEPHLSEYLCVVSILVGSFFLFFTSSLDSFLVWSSVASAFWVFFLFSQGNFSFLLFYLIYGTALGSLLFSRSLWRGIILMNSIFFWQFSLAFLFLAGLPPFSLFLFKIDVTRFLFLSGEDYQFLIFWLASFLGLLGYFKIFFKNFYFMNFLYNFSYSHFFRLLVIVFMILPFPLLIL